MKFRVGDKVKCIRDNKQLVGCNGVIARKCPILNTLCAIVRISNGYEYHILTKYLRLNQKNQQLLFNFMR